MKAIVTGAAGFAGYHVTEHLIQHGYEVYAIVRPDSSHNNRLLGLGESLHIIELDYNNYDRLPSLINSNCDILIHLAWVGGRDNFDEQYKNIKPTIEVIEASSKLCCKRFIGIGSQAEYGVVDGLITEELLPNPINAYGSAKVAANFLSKRRAEQLGMEWVWGRIFSLIGKYEPNGRMIPDLICKCKEGEVVNLSDCSQKWDYLDAGDAAEAIISIAETGKDGNIYNIASGDCIELRQYVRKVTDLIGNSEKITFGEKADPYISLSVSNSKLCSDTGWRPSISFTDCINNNYLDKSLMRRMEHEL